LYWTGTSVTLYIKKIRRKWEQLYFSALNSIFLLALTLLYHRANKIADTDKNKVDSIFL